MDSNLKIRLVFNHKNDSLTTCEIIEGIATTL